MVIKFSNIIIRIGRTGVDLLRIVGDVSGSIRVSIGNTSRDLFLISVPPVRPTDTW